MPNNYFKFKQFTVYQDKSAMKVGTDGVLLGAWANLSDAKNVLDIGTGTGLISLMINQRLSANVIIDAIDIDEDAIVQAKENIEKAGAGNINCIRQSLQSFAENCNRKYDLVISNPPYFSSSLHSPDKQRTMARHTDTLPIESLIGLSARLITDTGKFAIIYPYTGKELLISITTGAGLYVSRITDVYPTPQSEPKRILLEFSKTETAVQHNQLIIETKRHVYSDEYIALTRDFYLKM